MPLLLASDSCSQASLPQVFLFMSGLRRLVGEGVPWLAIVPSTTDVRCLSITTLHHGRALKISGCVWVNGEEAKILFV